MIPDGIQIRPIPAFKDNYIWLLHDGQHAAVVDPGVAEPVLRELGELKLELSAILLTHLHYDHHFGVPGLLDHWQVPVFGPFLNEHDRTSHPPFPRPGTVPLDCVTDVVGNGDQVAVPGIGADLSVLEIAGHTKGHIAFLDEQRHWLFCGDTLFAGGCGKVFGGSMPAMVETLDRLATLPPQTQVYCAHEYTIANLRFAMVVEPSNTELQKRNQAEVRKRDLGLPTLPSTIGLERATNPFLRVMEPEILESLRVERGVTPRTRVAAFEALRAWKDEFR